MLSATVKLVLKITLLVFIAAYFLTYYYAKLLPDPYYILDEVKNTPPRQEEILKKPFDYQVAGFRYRIIPKFNYRLYGLVVSDYYSANILDFSHKKDPGNIKDICVVWGDNIKNEAYLDVKFSSGEFTCFYSWGMNFAAVFDPSQFANNHLIASTPEIASLVKKARRGDQIYAEGYLADYSVADARGKTISTRNTSISREDSGNGACEIIYLTQFEILKQGDAPAYTVNRLSLYIILIIIFILLGDFVVNIGRIPSSRHLYK